MPDAPKRPPEDRGPNWRLVDSAPAIGGSWLRRPARTIPRSSPRPPAAFELRPPFPDDSPEERRLRRANPDRLTPFLVLRTGPNDVGQVGVRRIALDSPTMHLTRLGLTTPTGFELKRDYTYTISGEVANLGAGPSLFGLATLYIFTGTQLAANWGEPYGDWFDVIDFRVPAGRSAAFHFRRAWTAGLGPNHLDDRISVVLHVVDVLADDTTFVVDGDGDRHCIRQDFHLT